MMLSITSLLCGNHVTFSRGILVDIWSQVREHSRGNVVDSTWKFPCGLRSLSSRGNSTCNPHYKGGSLLLFT